MRPGRGTDTGAVGMQGISVPIVPLRERAPDFMAARIEAAEARRSPVSRLTLEQTHRSMLSAQQDVVALQAKLDQSELDLQAARERIAGLEGQVAEVERERDDARQQLQVMEVPRPRRSRCQPDIAPGPLCTGGCGVPMDPAYVDRTGRTYHGPCAPTTAVIGGEQHAKTRTCAA